MTADCIRRAAIVITSLAVLLVLIAGLSSGLAAQDASDSGLDPLAPVNRARHLREIDPVRLALRLSTLAERYAAAMLERRCTCLAILGDVEDWDTTLTRDVRATLGLTTEDVRAGVTVAWDTTVQRGVAAAVGRDDSSGVLLARDITLGGVGSAVVTPGQSWLGPPTSGVGPEIDLTGYTIVVIVTARVESSP